MQKPDYFLCVGNNIRIFLFIVIRQFYLQIDSGKKAVITTWVMYHIITRKM